MSYERPAESAETPKQVVDRFIEFARHPFTLNDTFSPNWTEENETASKDWEEQMGFLFGDEDQLRYTKNQGFKGVPQIKAILEEALSEAGTDGLINQFNAQLAKLTQNRDLGELLPFYHKAQSFQI